MLSPEFKLQYWKKERHTIHMNSEALVKAKYQGRYRSEVKFQRARRYRPPQLCGTQPVVYLEAGAAQEPPGRWEGACKREATHPLYLSCWRGRPGGENEPERSTRF
jgi:hypothetical protein